MLSFPVVVYFFFQVSAVPKGGAHFFLQAIYDPQLLDLRDVL